MAVDIDAKRWAIAKRSLSDPYGDVWCAWCLDYIERPAELELHHVLGRRDDIKAVFGRESWVVPVHAPPERCHRHFLQDYAQIAGRRLLDGRETDGYEDRCRRAFYMGYLPACLYLHGHRAGELHQAGHEDLAQQHLLLALNAAAGSGLGQPFVQELPASDLASLTDDVNVQLYIASARGNFGDLAAARTACRELEARLPRVRGHVTPEYAKANRTQAILLPSVKAGKEAVTISRDSHDPLYHGCTSRLSLASAYDAAADYGATLDVANELASLLRDGPTLWWHRIHHHLLLARATVLSAGGRPSAAVLRRACANLTRAQYAATFLDWVGIPLPDCHHPGHGGDLAALRPTDVLHWLSGILDFSRPELLAMRREALFGEPAARDPNETWPKGFQAQVLDTLCAGPADDVGHPMPL